MRKFLLLILLIVLSACGGKESICLNPCGLVITLLPDAWTCKDVIDVEADLMIEEADAHDYRLHTCDLSRYEVEVHATQYWDFKGEPTMGLTYCHAGRIEINNAPPWENSLPHEMVHALQDCDPFLTPGSVDDRDHQGWTERGINAGLERVWNDLAPKDGGQ